MTTICSWLLILVFTVLWSHGPVSDTLSVHLFLFSHSKRIFQNSTYFWSWAIIFVASFQGQQRAKSAHTGSLGLFTSKRFCERCLLSWLHFLISKVEGPTIRFMILLCSRIYWQIGWESNFQAGFPSQMSIRKYQSANFGQLISVSSPPWWWWTLIPLDLYAPNKPLLYSLWVTLAMMFYPSNRKVSHKDAEEREVEERGGDCGPVLPCTEDLYEDLVGQY